MIIKIKELRFLYTSVFVLAILICIIEMETDQASGSTIIVASDGSGEYTQIQSALDNSKIGDDIRVYSGTYYENVDVDKFVRLIGNGSDDTIIDGGGSGEVVRIRRNSIKMSGFQIINGGISGISLESEYCEIFDNNCSGNRGSGLKITADNNNIHSNVFFNNFGSGIRTESAHDNTVSENEFIKNAESGVYLYNGEDNTISENRLIEGIVGITIAASDNNEVTLNIIEENTDYGFFITTSTENTFSNNEISGSIYGIHARQSSDHNNYQGNSIENNSGIGINLNRDSGQSLIDGNTFFGNEDNDVLLDNTIGNTLSSNQFSDLGITIKGDSLEYWNTHTIDSSNTVNGKSITYRKDESGIMVTDSGQVILANCNSSIVINNNCSNRDSGIVVSFCTDIIIENNTCVSNSENGIFLYKSHENALSNNTVRENGNGIKLVASSSNRITYNNIFSNGNGIRNTENSHDNKVHFNLIEGNSNHGINVGNNNGKYINSIHNWWNDPTGPYHQSNNADGLGDSVTNYVYFDPWLIYDTRHVHNEDLGLSYYLIQEAVNRAKENNTIRVDSGLYHERLSVEKPISIIGQGAVASLISPNRGAELAIIEIKGSGITFRGFSLDGWKEPDENGIEFIYANDCTVEDMSIANCSVGLKLFRSVSISLAGNTFHGNGLFIEGNEVDHWNSHYIQRSNVVDEKPIRYVSNEVGRSLIPENGPIILANCTGMVIKDQSMNNSFFGILLGFSSNNSIWNCSFSGNQYGIMIRTESNDNVVTRNVCEKNMVGIELSENELNFVSFNVCNDNSGSGILTKSMSEHNIIANNTCANNDEHGISLGSQNNQVEYNDCSYNKEMGISDSSRNTLSFNRCAFDATGIHLGSYSKADHNNCSDNKNAGIGMLFTNGAVISNCTIRNNEYGLYFWGYSGGNRVEYSDISHNKYGLKLGDSSGNVIENSSIHNNEMGVFPVSFSRCNFYNCSFLGNSAYAIEAGHDGSAVKAIRCWWGDPSGPYHVDSNANGTGDTVKWYVTFVPWLGQPHPPIAEILMVSPTEVEPDQPVTFSGRALYFTGNDIGQFVWTSSINGELYNGSEAQFSTKELIPGSHTITLKVRDSQGQWSNEVITNLSISQRPRVAIKPVQQTHVMEGTDITLEADVFGHPAITLYVWNSDVDGLLYSGTSPSFNTTDLSIGTHSISVIIQDEDGIWSNEVSIQLIVVEIDGERPSLTIESPQDGTIVNKTLTISGTSIDNVAIELIEYLLSGSDEWIAANGTTSWNVVLDTTQIDDGKRMIQFRAFDGTQYSQITNLTIEVKNGKGSSDDDTLFGTIGPVPILALVVLILVVVFGGIVMLMKQRSVKGTRGKSYSPPAPKAPPPYQTSNQTPNTNAVPQSPPQPDTGAQLGQFPPQQMSPPVQPQVQHQNGFQVGSGTMQQQYPQSGFGSQQSPPSRSPIPSVPPPQSASHWTCPQCSNSMSGEFFFCMNCGFRRGQ